MGKNIFFGLVLGAIIIVLLIFGNRQPFGKRNSSFAIDPSVAVTKVEFTQGDSKLTLERDNRSEWHVNGNYEARANGITFIEKVVTGIEIKSTVTEATFEEEITKKGIEPVRVKIYEGRKVVKSYLVYKTGSNQYGNIMKTATKAKPFIVYVPGYDFDIGSAFTLNENYWRPYTLFGMMPSDISSVELKNWADTSASFKITNSAVSKTISISPSGTPSIDTTLVKRYLTYYSMVPFESWALELNEEQKVAITSQMPVFELKVIETSGKTSAITLWPRIINGELDTDRLWAKIDDNTNLVVVSYFDIDPIIKKRSYFFVDNKSLGK